MDLGYFDPLLDKVYREGDIVTAGKDLYYRDVILYCERIKDLTTIKGTAVIRTNLNTCLRGSALIWYISELSDILKSGLRSNENGVKA